MPHLSKFIIQSSTYFLPPHLNLRSPLLFLLPPLFFSHIILLCSYEQQSALLAEAVKWICDVGRCANWMQHQLFTMLLAVLLYWPSKMPLKCISTSILPLPPATTTFSFKVFFQPVSLLSSFFVFSQHISTISLFLVFQLVSIEYMMDENERRNIVEEPVRKCPIPAPRTSVPSPSASPSLRHKSE